MLEMLEEQSNVQQRLAQGLNENEQKLRNREIMLNDAMAVAEASVQMSRVFEAAETAGQQYISALRLRIAQERYSNS
jgi:thiazole synthase ThiGH ThiG subunit